ncbi:MAG: tetratricopeptide repeat protein [Brumimicrobium sp.]|nr:tetratricopeptide repeat protein [Brumimicrobium sp.]
MFDEENDDNFEADFHEQLAALDAMYINDNYTYLDPENIEFLLDHLLISNQIKKAMWLTEKSLEHFPQNSLFSIRLAQIHSLQGDFTIALKILMRIEQLEPLNLDVLVGLATCYSQLKNSDLSIKYYRKAYEVAGLEEKEDVAIDFAIELEKKEEYKMAISLLEQAINDIGISESIVYEIAHCYEKLNEYDKAVQCFLDYIDDNPYSYMSWYNLGNTYSKIGNSEKAIWAYEYTIVIHEDFIPALYSLATAHFDADNIEEALESFYKCLEIDDKDPIILCSIGECHEELGDLEAAYDYYSQSCELMPNLGEAWLGRAIVSKLLGMFPRAIQEIKLAIDIDGNNPEYWETLGDIYQSDFQMELASEAYKNAFELAPFDDNIIEEYLLHLLNNESIEQLLGAFDHPLMDNKGVAKIIYCYAKWKNGDQTESLLIFDELLQEDIKYAKKFFSFFPEMKEESYFWNLMEEFKKRNK